MEKTNFTFVRPLRGLGMALLAFLTMFLGTQSLQAQSTPTCGCVEVNVTLNDTSCTFKLDASIIAMQNTSGGTTCSGLAVRVADNNPLNGDIIDCPGYWTYGLFRADGSLVCWGKVRAEDKSGPKLVRWEGRCGSQGTTGTASANVGQNLNNNNVTILDAGVVRRDTFLCFDVEDVYNKAASWGTTTDVNFAGRPIFQDGCNNRRNSGSSGNSGVGILCDCRTDVRVNDQIKYYTCNESGNNIQNGFWAVITRVFTATDCMGNTTTVTQEIYFVRPEIRSLEDEVLAGLGSGFPYGSGAKSSIMLVGTADPELIVTLDSLNCDAPTKEAMLARLLDEYYIFNDARNCDGNSTRDDYKYFAAGDAGTLLQCNYSFDAQIMAEYPVCDGRGKKVVVMTNYFDWCTGVKEPLDVITLKAHDSEPPVITETSKLSPVQISTGPLDCTASFGIDVQSLKDFFGVVVADNAGGCGIRDVSVRIRSCVDSVGYGIILGDKAWRYPVYQTATIGGRRMVFGVPVGRHRLEITATDNCYSQLTQVVTFEVIDEVAPVVKCTDQLNVTLSNTMGAGYGQIYPQAGTNIYGYARVLASQINVGSTDNCGLDWVRVRRVLLPDNKIGRQSYFNALRDDLKFRDVAPTGSLNAGDWYDWNGNGTLDNDMEAFHTATLPLGSSSATTALMTPLLDWVDFFCDDYNKTSLMVELWASDKVVTINNCDGSTLTSGGNMNYCWMNVQIEDKVSPTFIRPWDVSAFCTDRAWLDSLNSASKVSANQLASSGSDHSGTLQLWVNADGNFSDRVAGSGDAAKYQYIEDNILEKDNKDNKFVRLTGADCDSLLLDVVVTRLAGWHCDAGRFTVAYRPAKKDKNGVWPATARLDGNASWPIAGTGQVSTSRNTVTITIEPVHEYTMRFPADVTNGNCNSVPAAKDIAANVADGGELSCDVLAVLVQDKKYNGATANGVPVAECFKIFRTFTVVNWCQYDERCQEPMIDAVILPRAAAGLTVSVRDANKDKNEEVYFGTSLVATQNGSLFSAFTTGDNSGGSTTNGAPTCANQNGPTSSASPAYKGRNNGPEWYAWMYTQYIFVHDVDAPVVTTVVNEKTFSKANCVSTQKITITATDLCAAREIQTQPSGSGTSGVAIERVILIPQGGSPINIVNGDDITGVNLGDVVTTNLLDGDNKGTNSWVYNGTNLPDGTHELRVVVRDDCGNLSKQSSTYFTVGDDIGTAPICINGLSTNLLPDVTGGTLSANIWATDFLASAVYDCNGQGTNVDPDNAKLKEITAPANYFVYKDSNKDGKIDASDAGLTTVGGVVVPNAPGQANRSINITCADLTSFTGNPPSGTRSVLIRVYNRDLRNNWAWCETFVSVDNATSCAGGTSTSAAVAGAITTESNLNVEGVEVNLSGKAAMTYMTNAQGQFSFNGLAKGYDYTVTPQLDKNYLNGVSTFDLVLITKHILGVQPLNSAYKLIAADVNNSKSVTTLDLIQLRKLVLNIDTKFANNTSWRFVDASFRFPNAANPWATQFPEVANLNDLAVDARANFIAVKVGDVNGNAVASASARTAGTFNLNVDDQQLKAGNEYRVAISGDLSSIEGMQFTMNYNNKLVELVNIEYGVAKEEHFGIFTKEGVITASWNGNASNGVIATLVFRASADANLSEVLNLNSRYTAAEAYNRSGEQLGVALNFAGAQSKVAGFELKQNTPNPFAGETVIGFNLPVAGEATLTIQDVTGRTLRVVRGQYAEGYNQVTIKSADLGATGVLYYTLEASDFVATKKMIIVE